MANKVYTDQQMQWGAQIGNGIINDYKKENEIIEISNTKSLLWD